MLVGTASVALHELAAIAVDGQMGWVDRVIHTRATGIDDSWHNPVTVRAHLLLLLLGPLHLLLPLLLLPLLLLPLGLVVLRDGGNANRSNYETQSEY